MSRIFSTHVHISRSRVGPGDPAAHRTDRLPLLPSGPGGIHRVLLHRAQPLLTNSSRSIINAAVNPSSELDDSDRAQHCFMAERVGFEPTVPLPRRMLSKHVDSSTLAPLRDRTTSRGRILSRRSVSGKVRPGHHVAAAIDRLVERFYTAALF